MIAVLTKIPNIILLVVTLAVCLGSQVLRNYYSKRVAKNTASLYSYCAFTSVVCAVFLWAVSGFYVKISWYTVVLALLFGTVVALNTVMSSMALKIGPMSYTSVLGSSSTIITALSGLLFWGERIGAFKWIGLAFMTVCLTLSVKQEKDEKAASLKWFTLAILAAVFSACVGLLQKTHQRSAYKEEIFAFLIIAFFFSFLFSLGMYLFTKNKGSNISEKVDKGQRTKKILIKLGVIFFCAGICTSLNHFINLYLSGVMESVVFFPIVNGGGLVLNILASLLLFREKLSKKQWIGISCGVIATVLLAI